MFLRIMYFTQNLFKICLTTKMWKVMAFYNIFKILFEGELLYSYSPDGRLYAVRR